MSGRLTRDPEARFAADGTPVTSFTLAFHRKFRARDGSAQEQAGFLTVLTYQRLAEVCGQYLHKGSAVLVEGRLQMRKWAGPRGETRERIELRGESVHFLERAPGGKGPAEQGEGGMDPLPLPGGE